MSATIQKLEQGLAAAEQEALQAFWAFAEQAARAEGGDGEPPAIFEVQGALTAAGKSTGDFRKAVEIKRRRLRLRQTADALSDANAALAAAEKAEAEHKAAAQARAEADRRLAIGHAEKVAKLRAAVAAADNAQHELRQGSRECRPWLYSSAKAGAPTGLGRLMLEIRSRLDSLPVLVRNRKSEIGQREGSPWRFGKSAKIGELRAEIEQLQREESLLKAKLKACEAAVAAGIVPDEVALQP